MAPGGPGAAPPSGAMVPPMSAQPGFGMVSKVTHTLYLNRNTDEYGTPR